MTTPFRNWIDPLSTQGAETAYVADLCPAHKGRRQKAYLAGGASAVVDTAEECGDHQKHPEDWTIERAYGAVGRGRMSCAQ